jgi:hypothetical protein
MTRIILVIKCLKKDKVCDNLVMDAHANRNSKMLLTTRLTGVTFEGRQERLRALHEQGDDISRKLRHKNHHDGYEGIAVFHGSEDLGWIPADIAVDLLLPEITASTIQIDSFELADIVGGTLEKENFGAEVVMFLSGDSYTLDILSNSINELQRKATAASVMDGKLKNISELKESHAKKVKHTQIDNDHKLYIIGDTHVQPNDIRKILREYGVTESQFEIENDYYALKNEDSIRNRFKYLFFGATPHSGRGMGEDNSIIEHYEKMPDFVVSPIRNETGQLKITANGLRSALEALVIA